METMISFVFLFKRLLSLQITAFLRAEKASAYIHEDKALGSKFWKDIHILLSTIEVDTSLKEGKLIAKKLHEDRLAALEKFLSNI